MKATAVRRATIKTDAIAAIAVRCVIRVIAPRAVLIGVRRVVNSNAWVHPPVCHVPNHVALLLTLP
jgi:hypothetical protein